jgi:putative ABC transport system permease protein
MDREGQMRLGTELGLKSLWQERASFVFASVSLAAVLGPLLVLWGLKNGVVGALLGALSSDPATLEVQFRGHVTLRNQELQRISSLPGIGFVLPDISSIAADVAFESIGSAGLVRAEAWPTADRDPTLPQHMAAPRMGETILTTALAEQLKVKPGDAVTLLRHRGEEGRPVLLRLMLRVSGVLPPASMPGNRAFLPYEQIERLQAFVDGYALPEAGGVGRSLSERPQVYERIRLYAAGLEQVAPLVSAMESLGYAVTSRAADVEGVLQLERNLVSLFTLVAGIGSVGYLVSLWASLAASLARKRRDLSLFRLVGGLNRDLIAFTLSQGCAVATAGTALALTVYAMLGTAVNAWFASALPGHSVCFLTILDVAVASAGTLTVVLFVAWAVGRPLLRIAPSEVLHEA